MFRDASTISKKDVTTFMFILIAEILLCAAVYLLSLDGYFDYNVLTMVFSALLVGWTIIGFALYPFSYKVLFSYRPVRIVGVLFIIVAIIAAGIYFIDTSISYDLLTALALLMIFLPMVLIFVLYKNPARDREYDDLKARNG